MRPLSAILVGFTAVGVCGVLPFPSHAGSITPLASYQPSEMGNLLGTRNPSDLHLSITIAPPGR
jgi:hypothetical protein